MDDRDYRYARTVLVAQFGISVVVLVACMLELSNFRNLASLDQTSVNLIVFITGVWLGRTPSLWRVLRERD